MITKQIFSYYNTNFLLEITSKVQKVHQKYTFTHKLTTKRNFQTPSLFFSSTVTEWNAQDCGISKAAKDTSMLPSKIDQMKVSHERGSEANFGFGRALMPSCLGMLPPKAAFFSFRMQPTSVDIWTRYTTPSIVHFLFFFLLSTIFLFSFFYKQHNIISKIKQNKTADTYSTSKSSIKRDEEREGQQEHKSHFSK